MVPRHRGEYARQALARRAASGNIHIMMGSSQNARPNVRASFRTSAFCGGRTAMSATGDVRLQLLLLGLQLFHPPLHHVTDADDAGELAVLEDLMCRTR